MCIRDSLDTISERKVQKSLESVMKDRTVVVIAHRLTTIQNADVIVVLHNGLIVEVCSELTNGNLICRLQMSDFICYCR